MKNVSQYVMIALLVIGVITFLMSVVSGNHDPMLYYSYILSIGVVGVAILGSIYGIITNPAGMKGGAIGIGSLVAILGISYGMATDAVPTKYAETLTASASKLSGAGLYAVYILLALAILSIVFSSVSKLVK